MGLNLKGYVLEKPRIGAANSTTTPTPDNLVSDSVAFSAVYGSDESTPGRTEYLTLVLVDGDLASARFGWTKNEQLIQRFGYEGSEQRFWLLNGGPRLEVGVVDATVNTTRLMVPPPIASAAVGPFRLALGSSGSGMTVPITTVATDANFTTPSLGTVQLSLSTGRLNWNPTDITTTFLGQTAFFQRQGFFSKSEATGKIGEVGEILLLNPIPATGQYPLIRFGFGLPLTPIERANEAGFSVNPSAGTVEWARDTGRIKFNASESVSHPGSVYFLGVLLGYNLQLPRQVIGTVSSPTTIVGLPTEGADLIFQALPLSSEPLVQFEEAVLVENFSSGKSGEVEVDSAGNVRFSTPDQQRYGSRTARVIFGDLPLERGLSLRMFRSPVDLSGTDPSIKDVSAFYPVEGATLADPIIGTPVVFLPVAPVDDPAYPMVFTVEQGTGSFLGDLPRLDVGAPPAGVGYTLDFDAKQLTFAARRVNTVTSIQRATGAIQLADPLINPNNATFELDQGSGYNPLVEGEDYLLDSVGGVLSFITTLGVTQTSGSTGSITGTTFTDLQADFTPVQVGDYLVILTGSSTGVYQVGSVTLPSTLTINPGVSSPSSNLGYEIRRSKEVLADRFFQEVSLADPTTKVEKIRPLGTITNSPRMTINSAQAATSRFRFGTEYQPAPIVVANDGAFSSPASMASGVVEVSQSTGHLNFAQDDVTAGGTAFWVFLLIQGTDYRIEPQLGVIQTIERLLSLDELLLTYSSLQDSPPTPIEERATFLVRKEVTSHPQPTSTISFNPLGREVANVPAPTVYRGGRKQDGTQIVVSPEGSTFTFLPDKLPTPGGAYKVTDATPHGAVVQPSERVYIDYYVYNAVGGENTTTVLKAPINLAKVQITEGQSFFTIKGNRTSDFPANRVLRIGAEQVYYLAGSTYDGGTDSTTVNLLAPQVFRDSFSAPRLYISSGAIRTTSALFQPSYFTVESAAFDAIPRGMNRFYLAGDLTGTYVSGRLVSLSGAGNQDFFLVSGSNYKAELNRTEVTLTQTTGRQYTSSIYTLRRSIRPVYEAATRMVQTSASPVVPPEFDSIQDSVVVFRQLDGAAGALQTPNLDYTIDDSGVVKFTDPLKMGEEFSIFYTRSRLVQPGQLRATYTATIAPNATNGLLNQVLVGSYTAYLPDSTYFRVETMTNFRGEIVSEYRTQASSATGGPRLANFAQPKLFQQGQESVFFQEGHLANEDIVARATLKYYNDAINLLEDLLSDLDGRVVGDRDGRFLFDGTTGAPVSNFSSALNQIDDTFAASKFPIDFTPPLFPFKFINTRTKAYAPSASSRFYPTFRRRSNYTVVGQDTSAETGDEMVDLTDRNLTSTSSTASRRYPRARVTALLPMGGSALQVDTTSAVTSLPGPFRPAFVTGMKVVIRDESGTYLVTQGSPATVTVTNGTTLTLSPSPGVDIPQGSTITLAKDDDTYQKSYRIGFDVNVDREAGVLTYVEPFPPLDGSDVLVPSALQIQPPNSGELLSLNFRMSNGRTAPEKFPALYGQALDDDGDVRLPIINPRYTREVAPASEPGSQPSALNNEVGGYATIVNSTQDAFRASGVGATGSLDATRTIITCSTAFPSPTPQLGDLVRILDGLNGTTSFHRVVGVSANTVTVDVAFTAVDVGFDFLLTTASNLESGTLSSMVGTTITDAAANFQVAGVQPGHTVVLMQPGHPARFERRQVAQVLSATQIQLSAAFSNTITPATYRVVNPINTFSNQPTSYVTQVLALLGDEVTKCDAFFAMVLTDRLSPTIASGSITNSTTLVGSGVDYLAAGVVPGDIVYVQPGQASAGFYEVLSVVNATTLQITGTFPVTGATSFRVAKVFGVGIRTLVSVFSARTSSAVFQQATTTWQTSLTTPIGVLVPPGTSDPSYFAREYVGLDLSLRAAAVASRQSFLLATTIPEVESVLTSGDRMYDRRYTWIDTRINLQNGILVQQERAIARRKRLQQEALDQLIKILAVEGA